MKKSLWKYLLLAVVLIGVIIGGKFLISSLSNPKTPKTNYTITYYYSDEINSVFTQSVEDGEFFTLVTPSRNGYNFLGWFNNDNTQINNGKYKFGSDIVLFARWELKTYHVTYNTNGGVIPSTSNYYSSFNIDSYTYFTLPCPTKDEQAFIGWYDNADFEGEPIYNLFENEYKDWSLYAKYTDNPAEYLLFTEIDGEQVVTGYIGEPIFINIPSSYQGMPVTMINDSAFENCPAKSIVISDSVTSIGRSAFCNCSSLTSVTIGNSVTSIGNAAFDQCSSLTSVVIPDSVTSIGDSAFYWCSSLTSVTFPNSVTSIGRSAFEYCSSLTSVVIPDSVTSIGDSAFSGCRRLTSVTIPDSVTRIHSSVFSNCNSLQKTVKNNVEYLKANDNPYHIALRMVVATATTLTINENCKFIVNSAFENCTSLTSVTIPNSVMSIGNSAFSGCSNLKAVYITDIEKWCRISFGGANCANPLYYANNLYLNGKLVTNLIIPDSITEIKDYAFYGCSSLTSITIPDSVTSIGYGAFCDCGSLKAVYVTTKEKWNTVSIGDSNYYLNSSTLYYYSATKPTAQGNYWHYVNGVITVW